MPSVGKLSPFLSRRIWIAAILSLIHIFGQVKELDRRLVVSCIKSIQVSEKGNLEITFWFEDEFRKVIAKIRRICTELPNQKMKTFLESIGEGGVMCG